MVSALDTRPVNSDVRQLPLNMTKAKYWNNEKNEAEEVKMMEVKIDGTFSILAFEGFEYILKAYIVDKNGKTHCGFAKITVDKELTPLKIILNRTKKCSVENYAKEWK